MAMTASPVTRQSVLRVLLSGLLRVGVRVDTDMERVMAARGAMGPRIPTETEATVVMEATAVQKVEWEAWGVAAAMARMGSSPVATEGTAGREVMEPLAVVAVVAADMEVTHSLLGEAEVREVLVVPSLEEGLPLRMAQMAGMVASASPCSSTS